MSNRCWNSSNGLPRNSSIHEDHPVNRGNLSFAEVGQWAGVSASDWPGAPFLDVGSDGFEDVHSNGHERNGRDIDVSINWKARNLGDRSKREILQKRMELPLRHRQHRLEESRRRLLRGRLQAMGF